MLVMGGLHILGKMFGVDFPFGVPQGPPAVVDVIPEERQLGGGTIIDVEAKVSDA